MSLPHGIDKVILELVRSVMTTPRLYANFTKATSSGLEA